MLCFIVTACNFPVTPQSASNSHSAHPLPQQAENCPEQLDSIFVKNNSLSYNGFNVAKLKKKVLLKYPSEKNLNPESVEVSYAVLKRNGKEITNFDGVYFGAGNATDFGLFPFLGGAMKQLAVSQTTPRTGRHWVSDISLDGRIIFDSSDWGVGGEDFSIIDIDKDGIYEISLPITEFYIFEGMSMAETPLPEIIFKFDKKPRKYFPANPSFQEYTLKGVDDEIKQLDPNDDVTYLSKRLSIVLRFVYAGRETEAWSFFDKVYERPDKEKLRVKIESVLKNDKVYRYIYGLSSNIR